MMKRLNAVYLAAAWLISFVTSIVAITASVISAAMRNNRAGEDGHHLPLQ